MPIEVILEMVKASWSFNVNLKIFNILENKVHDTFWTKLEKKFHSASKISISKQFFVEILVYIVTLVFIGMKAWKHEKGKLIVCFCF